MTAPSPSKRVLVVDDDPAVRELLQRVLSKGGHQVDAVVTGDEGIAAFESNGYDVMLVDKNLPRLDGFAVARHALRVRPAMAVVMITAATEILTPSDAQLLDVYLGKPFKNLAGIGEAIDNAVEIRANKMQRAKLQRSLEGIRASLKKPSP